MSIPVVIITGAGRGLGRALVQAFSGHGWFVIATDADRSLLDNPEGKSNVLTLFMDVTSDDSVTAARKRISAEISSLDLIINNAGIDRYFPFSEAPPSCFREVFDVNLFGAYRVNQAFIAMLKRPGGRIIQLGSESLNLTLPFMPYPISKNIVERYAKSLRQEVRFLGIDVIVVRPGPIRTQILDKVHTIEYPVNDPLLDKVFRKFASSAPSGIGKVSEPWKVAEFIFRVSRIRKPRAVYKINNSLMLKLLRLFPFSVLEKLIAGRLRVH